MIICNSNSNHIKNFVTKIAPSSTFTPWGQYRNIICTKIDNFNLAVRFD